MKPVICYTGIGAQKSGVHSDEQFQKIIETQLKKTCRTNCPKTVDGGASNAGAARKSAKQCKDVTRLNLSVDKASKAASKANQNLRECVQKQCAFVQQNGSKDAVDVAVCASRLCGKAIKKLNEAGELWNKASTMASKRWDARK
jgi:hypothetical protein